jgi:sec-independent protein translocase protein TatA
MFDNIGGTEILVILFVVFIFFGPKKLPELGKNIGKGIREFRNAMSSVQRDLENSTKDLTTDLKKSANDITNNIRNSTKV